MIKKYVYGEPFETELPRKDDCTNAPRIVLSRTRSFAVPHTTQKQMVLTIAQKSTYLISNTALISTPAMSLNSINGSVTLKLNLFATVTKLSFSIPICFKMYPITMTRKIGIVTLILYIKFSIFSFSYPETPRSSKGKTQQSLCLGFSNYKSIFIFLV